MIDDFSTIERGDEPPKLPHDGNRKVQPLVRSYTCDCCGRVGQWGKGWKVWGSLALRVDGRMIVACSESCSCNIDVKHTWLNKYGETIKQSERRIGNFG